MYSYKKNTLNFWIFLRITKQILMLYESGGLGIFNILNIVYPMRIALGFLFEKKIVIDI